MKTANPSKSRFAVDPAKVEAFLWERSNIESSYPPRIPAHAYLDGPETDSRENPADLTPIAQARIPAAA